MIIFKKLITTQLQQNHNLRFYSKVTLSKGWFSKAIIKDVIDDVPSSRLIVDYPEIRVAEGNFIMPSQAVESPEVLWKVVQKDSFYTLCMIDPDCPSKSKPVFREWLHWLVVNIPCNHMEKGDVLAEYIGPGPPKGTEYHRYIFLLYKQPGELSFKESRLEKTAKGREKFNSRSFAKKYLLGEPVAGNFFEAQYDESVPKLLEAIGAKTVQLAKRARV